MIHTLYDEITYPHRGEKISSDSAMELALRCAHLGAAHVSPNPLVGCVIVDENHNFIACGYHERYGEAHAEICALNKIAEQDRALLKNSTVYVTLEPCAHQGKTPSCARTLSLLPIKKVIYGLQDPNPLVSGQGAQILKNAKIEVELYEGSLKNRLFDLVEIFLKNFMQKKIFVTVKVASSLDGQMALKSGESKWITSEVSREFSHELRSRYDAVLIGKNTILKDNPSLNIRHSKIEKKNKVVILDRTRTIQNLIADGKKFKFQDHHADNNIIFPKSKKIDEQLEELWGFGVRSVFVEGGAEIISQLFQKQLIDRLHLFTAPVIIGSVNGVSWTSSFGIQNLMEKLVLKNPEFRQFGSDSYVTGKF
jgi:diaminohydroxyphosphoribosylaminopyrimidine deaminase / 5-amino-6-(5-phosphoribosylamino)uracil reductase